MALCYNFGLFRFYIKFMTDLPCQSLRIALKGNGVQLIKLYHEIAKKSTYIYVFYILFIFFYNG